MHHEIEADYKEEWDESTTQCRNCTSLIEQDGSPYCAEARAHVPLSAHCDFFQSKD